MERLTVTNPDRPAPRATCWFCAWPLVGGVCAICDRDTETAPTPGTTKAADALHAPTAF